MDFLWHKLCPGTCGSRYMHQFPGLHALHRCTPSETRVAMSRQTCAHSHRHDVSVTRKLKIAIRRSNEFRSNLKILNEGGP